MNLRTITLATATALSSPAFGEPAPGATFDFQCVVQDTDGSFRAQFEHFIPLTDPSDQNRTRVGNAIGRHSEIVDPHTFLSDQATLEQLSDVHQRWLNDPDMGTEEQRFMLGGELTEMQEGVEALEQSEQEGVPVPSCEDEPYLGA